MLNRFLKFFSPAKSSKGPLVIDAAEHNIDPYKLSRNAVKVVDSLQRAGYLAYIVGGGVRDLLLQLKPKDFDVATNATPEQVKQVFRSALIIGRRFRIVHVRFGREIIEVTTFRAHHDDTNNAKLAKQSAHGALLLDNVYGDIQSDAVRRDFTVNALYLDPTTHKIYDFTNGLEDLKNRVLRIIGEPTARYREDPVRMLRAVRFAAKLGFRLEEDTAAPIVSLANLLDHIPSARLFEEVLKLMLSGSATACLQLLSDYRLLKHLFPGTDQVLQQGQTFDQKFVDLVAINTDKRIRSEQRVTPAFIFGAFLWLPLSAAMRKLQDEHKLSASDAMQKAAGVVIGQQLERTALPKRFLIPMREIWSLQLRLPKRDGTKARALLEHPRFRAAYDFLLVREDAGENLEGLGQWWTRFQTLDETQQDDMVANLREIPTAKRKPRKRKPKRRLPVPDAE